MKEPDKLDGILSAPPLYTSIYYKAEAIFALYLNHGHAVTSLVGERLYEAVEAGAISEQQRVRAWADLFWGGPLYETGKEVILAVVASWLVEESDVSRAAESAAILREIGLNALPVVAAVEWAEGVSKVARDRKVVMVTDGRIDEDSWWSAVANDPAGRWNPDEIPNLDGRQCHQVKQCLWMPKLVSVCGDGFHRPKRQQDFGELSRAVGASTAGRTCPQS